MQSPQPHFFAFEADFVDSLRCIPMVVRYKLDVSGIKLKLQHWHQLSIGERQQMAEMPCTTPGEIENYRECLHAMVMQYNTSPPKDLVIKQPFPWDDGNQIPEEVQVKAAACGVELTIEQWASLDPLKRFVLIKLSRPSHENYNFLPALREFELAS